MNTAASRKINLSKIRKAIEENQFHQITGAYVGYPDEFCFIGLANHVLTGDPNADFGETESDLVSSFCDLKVEEVIEMNDGEGLSFTEILDRLEESLEEQTRAIVIDPATDTLLEGEAHLYRTYTAASEAVWARGHEHALWELIVPPTESNGGRVVFRYTCPKCGAECDINTKPAPNEIDVGGSALAVNCPEPRQVWAVMIGNPFDGSSLFGPFENAELANDWADTASETRNSDWWVIELTSPTD